MLDSTHLPKAVIDAIYTAVYDIWANSLESYNLRQESNSPYDGHNTDRIFNKRSEPAFLWSVYWPPILPQAVLAVSLHSVSIQFNWMYASSSSFRLQETLLFFTAPISRDFRKQFQNPITAPDLSRMPYKAISSIWRNLCVLCRPNAIGRIYTSYAD